MENLMRIVFYFALKDRPGKEFSSECYLQKMNGVDLGGTYQNEFSFKVLLKYVAMALQKKIISAINKSKFISIMTDGSTSKKSIEYEAIVLRYIDDDSFKVTNSFIGLCNIEIGNSLGIADAIKKSLDGAEVENWHNKLICMTADGASVNIGKHIGIVKLIDSPTYIHCYNHVLDLCLKDTLQNNAAIKKCVALIKKK
jgi:hypothetical protein